MNGAIDVRGSGAAPSLGPCFSSAGSRAGGSGGSILVACQQLAASTGSLTADGGSSGVGGSAGRIAVVCREHGYPSSELSDINLTISAVGGASWSSSASAGAPGTVWLDLGADSSGISAPPLLLASSNSAAGAGTPQPAVISWPQQSAQLSPVQIALTRGARLQVSKDAALTGSAAVAAVNVVGNLASDGTGSLQAGPGVSLAYSPFAGAQSLVLESVAIKAMASAELLLPPRVVIGAGGALETVGAASASLPLLIIPTPLVVSSIAVLANGTLITTNGGIVLTNTLTVSGGGELTVNFAGNVSVSGDATFEAGSLVDGRGTGYAAGFGPGSSGSTPSLGGAHAGCGAQSNCGMSVSAAGSTALNTAYGNFTQPLTPGSGGSSSFSSCGAAGGAALRLHVSGTLQLDAVTDVSGASPPSFCSSRSGGSGGSISVFCQRLAPSSGWLVANGGLTAASAGRIAVVCREHSFASSSLSDISLKFSAVGGSTAGTAGAPGTVWLDLGVDVQGRIASPLLLVAGNSSLPTLSAAQVSWPHATAASAVWSGTRTIVRRGARLQLSRDASASSVLPASIRTNVTVVTAFSSDGTGSLQAGPGVALRLAFEPDAQSLLLENAALRAAASGELLLPPTVTIGAGGVLETVGSPSPVWPLSNTSVPLSIGSLFVLSGGTVAVANGGSLTCSSLLVKSGGRVAIAFAGAVNVTGDAHVESGSLIDGRGAGFPAGMGPGSPGSAVVGGAAHAGCGGQGTCTGFASPSSATPGNVSQAYGWITAPALPGSGGGYSGGANAVCGGLGGAALRLHVDGTLQLNATVDVSAMPTASTCAAGANDITGASGGSIFVACSLLGPSFGVLAANGSSGALGGSAGRIAIVCGQHSFASSNPSDVTLSLSAAGGSSSRGPAGAAGTIWLSFNATPGAAIDDSISRLLIAAPRGVQTVAPTVLMTSAPSPGGNLVVEQLALANAAAVHFAPAVPATSVGAATSAFFTVHLLTVESVAGGGRPRSLSVGPGAQLLLRRQNRTAAADGTPLLEPALISISDGALRTTAILTTDAHVTAARVQLSDPDCSHPDSCTSYVGQLLFQETGLTRFCSALYGAPLLQTWTRARFLRLEQCTGSSIIATYDFKMDPRPWLFFESPVTVGPPVATGAGRTVSSGAVLVQLSALARVTVPRSIEWSTSFSASGTLLGRLAAADNIRFTISCDAPPLPPPAAPSEVLTLPVPGPASPAPRVDADGAVSLLLRYVSSRCPMKHLEETDAAQDDPSVAAASQAWRVHLSLELRIPAGFSGSGALQRANVSSFLIPIVRPRRIALPPLLPRAGTVLSVDSGAMLPVTLPANAWTAAEAAAICDVTLCSVSIGGFNVSTTCPAGGQPDVRLFSVPAGFGVSLPASLSLWGGLLNIPLGALDYAPAAPASAYPRELAVPHPSRSQAVQLHVLPGVVEDAAFIDRIFLGNISCVNASVVKPLRLPSQSYDVAPIAITCSVSSGELLAAMGEASAARLPLLYGWGSSVLDASAASATGTGSGTAGIFVVALPAFINVAPVILSPNGVAVITGSNFCSGDPSGTCFKSIGVPQVQLFFERAAGLSDGFQADTSDANPSSSPGSPGSQESPTSQSNGTSADTNAVDGTGNDVWRVPCGDMQVLLDGVASCNVPALSPTEPGYPLFTAVLQSWTGVWARTRVSVSFPSSSGFVRPAGSAALPIHFLPSDRSSLWLLPAEVAVDVVLLATGGVFNGTLECSLAPRTVGVLVIPESPNTDFAASRGKGRVSFGRVGIQSSFAQASVTLIVSCTAPESSEITSLSPFNWTLSPYQLSITQCSRFPPSVRSLVPLPSVRIALALADSLSIQQPANTTAGIGNSSVSQQSSSSSLLDATGAFLPPPECSSNRSFTAFRLPTILCSVAAASGNGTDAVLQGNAVDLDRVTGAAEFASLRIGGPVGATFDVETRCSIGSIAIPAPPPVKLVLEGCARGSAPVGAACVQCSEGFWSAGGGQQCTQCPSRGAVCSGGILVVLPGFWRPPREQLLRAPLDGAAQLYPCLKPDRCLVNESTLEHSCVEGATGPLCALCDVDAGYADVGGVCTPCPSGALSSLAIAAFLLAFVGVVAFLVLRRERNVGARRAAAAESIALRILVTHVQALSALRAFRSSGLEAFAAVTAWADALTPGILVSAPSQCTLRPSAGFVFLGTLMAPVIACAVGLLILLAAAACGYAAEQDAVNFVDPSGTIARRNSWLIDGRGRSPFGRATGGCRGALKRLQDVWQAKEHIRVFVTVLSLAFMSVVSAW